MLSRVWRARLAAWRLPLILAALSVFVALVDWRDALRYQRAALLEGQVWRIFSAHLVHLNGAHLLLNLAGLALVWAIFSAELSGRAGWWAALSSALAISLGLLLFDPSLEWYVGLSGVLHGLFAAGTLRRWRAGGADAVPLLVVLAVKLLWEQTLGPLPGTSAAAGGPVVVDAHLYGALGGCVAALLTASTVPRDK